MARKPNSPVPPLSKAERTRVAFDMPADFYNLVRLEASKQSLPVAELARICLRRYIDSDSQDAQKHKPKRKTEGDNAKKARFLAAVEENFHSSKACKLTGIEKAQVKEWLKDPDFVSEFCDAQEAFIEEVESTMLKLASGEIKGGQGAFLAGQSFLNAHHPQHGRFKRELLVKILGPMMKRFYKVVSEVATDEIAGRINAKLKEVADEKLSEFTE